MVKGFQDADGARLENAHLLGLFHRLCKLMYYRVKPVFVFDGGVPILKQETIVNLMKEIQFQNEFMMKFFFYFRQNGPKQRINIRKKLTNYNKFYWKI